MIDAASNDPEDEMSFVDRFFRKIEEDRANGGLLPLAEYLRLFPGRDDVVASAFVAAAESVGRIPKRPQPASPKEATRPFADRYDIRREIGRGGQGTVHEAFDLKLRRPVALKLFHRGARAGDADWDRFQLEAGVAARLGHSGICPVYDVGRFEGTPFIAMQLLNGRTLAERLSVRLRPTSEGPMTGRDGASTATQSESAGARLQPEYVPGGPELAAASALIEAVARTLHAAHEDGVVHRDVKPGNIMVLPDGSPVVLDFGLATDDEAGGPALTRTGDRVGTPAYMSPEQLTDGAQVDRRTDVWALGATLFELSTLRRPFKAPTRDALTKAVCEEPLPDIRKLNRHVRPDVALVIATALEKSPKDRYVTALDFAEDLRRVRENLPILARPVGAGTRFARLTRRHPTFTAVSTALLLSLGIGLVVSLDLLAAERGAVHSFEILADARRVSELEAESESLWPLRAATVPKMEAWIDRAEELRARLGAYEAVVASTDAEVTRTGAAAGSPLVWKLDQLRELAAGIRRLIAPEPASYDGSGLLATVRRRLAIARNMRKQTIDDCAAIWREVCDSLSNRLESPSFDGFEMNPIEGLVPIGRDDESGLWEFYLPETGARPRIDPDRGAVCGEDTGIVLVLFPGFRDPTVEEEGPFLASKFETTRGQWVRIGFPRPAAWKRRGHSGGDAHPADFIDASMCETAARRLELILPDEALWTEAGRGGTQGRHAYGDALEELEGKVNLGDQSCGRELLGPSHGLINAPWDDGFPFSAPVGSFPPNRHGLYDVHGNVEEWTSTVVSDMTNRVVCGGSFASIPAKVCFDSKLISSPDRRGMGLGVRFFRTARR